MVLPLLLLLVCCCRCRYCCCRCCCCWSFCKSLDSSLVQAIKQSLSISLSLSLSIYLYLESISPLSSFMHHTLMEIYNIFFFYYSICGQHAVSFFLNSSAQHRENEAEPDSNGNKNFQSGPNVPCQSAQTDKSVSSA